MTFAANMAAVSGMEAVLLRHAWHQGLLKEALPEDGYRWLLKVSLAPVLLFIASMPVAFVLPWFAIALWFLPWPLQPLWSRNRPESTGEYGA